MSAWTKLRRLPRKPAFVYLAANILNRLSAVVLIPIYTRRLTLAEYGDYGLALTLLTVLGAVCSLNLVWFVSRVYFEGGDRKAAVARSGSVARWIVVVDLAFMLVLAAAVWAFVPEGGAGIWSRRALLLLLLGGAGTTLAPVPLVFFRAVQRPYLVATLQCVELVSTSAFGILFVVGLRRGFMGSMEALAAGGLVNGSIAAIVILLVLKGHLDLELLRSGVRFSAPILLQVLANWIQSAADRWSLKLADRGDEVGQMVLAIQVTQPAAMPAGALADSEFARVGELFRDDGLGAVGADLRSARRRYLLTSAVPAACVLAALPLLRFIIGPAASGTTLVLVPILCAIVIVDVQFYPAQLVVQYASRTRWMVVVALVTLVANIGLMVLLVPRFGIYGAVAAKAAGVCAKTGAMGLVAHACLRETRPEGK